MAINKKIIHFKKKEDFDNEVANGNILNHSIVFIQDSKEISTHGTVYKTVNWSILEPELYEWVDLGLPSGTLWAAWNVGATKPEEFGLYFAWGETEGYSNITDAKQFTWSDYKFSIDGSESNFSKYNSTDGLTTLEQVDDAAFVSDNLCRIPTGNERQELIDNTTSIWTNINGVNGIQLTSTVEGYTDKSIFIPAAGLVNNGSLTNVGSFGYIWSSSLFLGFYGWAWCMYFGSSNVSLYSTNRCNGLPVRPVKSNN